MNGNRPSLKSISFSLHTLAPQFFAEKLQDDF